MARHQCLTVYAKHAIQWAGTAYAKGAAVSMPLTDAVSHLKARHVSLKALRPEPEEASTPTINPIADAPDAPKRSRIYKRKDMQAEQPIVAQSPRPETFREIGRDPKAFGFDEDA